ncbi:hypothetical protein SODALDRAFT_358482 [Sodiomyces alkalinus F11]|uniref:Uncharacterized protein n=1 Tax=Sodiomyces alkalinus (strain CBS 110278 / VKM F-3762 / F11) TaxID=1314773 RepID=A0A3N2Q044_SODAK|nr:hypothetical protein SODALDRAFT_358482 [Sodiomyces alkalinus F11]ROT40058.1 hypothetical protein SODALDRAFT_358482 [Sodiomyces alkalinus F11]
MHSGPSHEQSCCRVDFHHRSAFPVISYFRWDEYVPRGFATGLPLSVLSSRLNHFGLNSKNLTDSVLSRHPAPQDTVWKRTRLTGLAYEDWESPRVNYPHFVCQQSPSSSFHPYPVRVSYTLDSLLSFPRDFDEPPALPCAFVSRLVRALLLFYSITSRSSRHISALPPRSCSVVHSPLSPITLYLRRIIITIEQSTSSLGGLRLVGLYLYLPVFLLCVSIAIWPLAFFPVSNPPVYFLCPDPLLHHPRVLSP